MDTGNNSLSPVQQKDNYIAVRLTLRNIQVPGFHCQHEQFHYTFVRFLCFRFVFGCRYDKHHSTRISALRVCLEGKKICIYWLVACWRSWKSNEDQVNSWHWFLFAPQEHSISWYASHSAEMLPFAHFSSPHNHQHFCLHDMETN